MGLSNFVTSSQRASKTKVIPIKINKNRLTNKRAYKIAYLVVVVVEELDEVLAANNAAPTVARDMIAPVESAPEAA